VKNFTNSARFYYDISLQVMTQELPVGLVRGGRLDWSGEVWNNADWRLSRLKAVKSLLAEDTYRSLYLVDGIGCYWPDLDMELINRDLGWEPESKLLATVIFDEQDIIPFNQIGSGPPIKPSYHIGCKILREGMNWQDKVGRALNEGDFIIRFSTDGVLKKITFRRTPPIEEEWKDGRLVTMHVSCVKGVDTRELLNLENSPERNREVASIADLILALLLQQGQRISVRQRSP
jgi:hypothetical protein